MEENILSFFHCQVAACGDHFCRSCLEECLDSIPAGQSESATSASHSPAVQCPGCEKPLTVDLSGRQISKAATSSDPGKRQVSKKGILGRMDLSKFQSSTKIEALVCCPEPSPKSPENSPTISPPSKPHSPERGDIQNAGKWPLWKGLSFQPVHLHAGPH